MNEDDLDINEEELEDGLEDLEPIDDEIGEEEDDLGIDLDEEIDEEAEIAAAAEAEDDNDNYSQKVVKRIGREVKKTKLQENRTREVETERDIVRSELHKSRREHAELQLKFNESEKKRLAYKVESLKKTASTALEEGQTEDYMTMNDEMLDAKVELSRVEAEVIEVPEEEPVPQNNMAQAASNWMNKNRSWINANPKKFAQAKRLSKVLKGEGYDVGDPEMYAELDARLNKKPTRMAQNANMPGSTVVKKSNGKTTLTSEDKKLMRKFSLNPNNVEDRKSWLAGKS